MTHYALKSSFQNRFSYSKFLKFLHMPWLLHWSGNLSLETSLHNCVVVWMWATFDLDLHASTVCSIVSQSPSFLHHGHSSLNLLSRTQCHRAHQDMWESRTLPRLLLYALESSGFPGMNSARWKLGEGSLAQSRLQPSWLHPNPFRLFPLGKILVRNVPCVNVFKSGLSTDFFDGSISCAHFDLVFEVMLSGPSPHDCHKGAIVVMVL